jgi:FAD/FMN-containing dehydrogenase
MRRRSAFPRAPTPAKASTRAEPIERVRAAFGDEAFGRLQALKRRYDPNNLLRQNQNIPPLGDGVASR